MGNKTSSFKCCRYLHSRSQYQVVFNMEQGVHDDAFDFKQRIMGLFKHEVYRMTLKEDEYADGDTRKLSIWLGYRTLCSATLDKQVLTIVFANTRWQDLWDTSQEVVVKKRYVYRWVAAVSNSIKVIVPLRYQWYVKKNRQLD